MYAERILLLCELYKTKGNHLFFCIVTDLKTGLFVTAHDNFGDMGQ